MQTEEHEDIGNGPSTTRKAFDNAPPSIVGHSQYPIMPYARQTTSALKPSQYEEATIASSSKPSGVVEGSDRNEEDSSHSAQKQETNPSSTRHPGKRAKYATEQLSQDAKQQIHDMRVYYTSEFNLKRKGERMRPATFDKFRERVLCRHQLVTPLSIN